MKKIREVYKILTLKYPIGSQAIQTGKKKVFICLFIHFFLSLKKTYNSK